MELCSVQGEGLHFESVRWLSIHTDLLSVLGQPICKFTIIWANKYSRQRSHVTENKTMGERY